VAALTAPALAAALLLMLAGALKVVDPSMTVGALRALGLPSAPWLVRLGAAAEVVVGALAVAAGGPIPWLVVAASYLAFAGFVGVALHRGTMIGSCGCFGREDTPPHVSHVLLNVVLAAVAAGAGLAGGIVPLDELTDGGGRGIVAGALALLAVYLLYVAYVELPRTRAARRGRSGPAGFHTNA
jgi:hypothetical protein